ncbi:MAG: hypothetical protein VCE43_10205, partial [Myxococcota bacterium]
MFLVFLSAASGWLGRTAGFSHPVSLVFLFFLAGAIVLVRTGRPTPLRWRVRLLGFAGISAGVYLALRWAIPLMHEPAHLDAVQAFLKAADSFLTLGTFFPGRVDGP